MTSAIARAFLMLQAFSSSQAASRPVTNASKWSWATRVFYRHRAARRLSFGTILFTLPERRGWGDMTSDRCALYRQFTAVNGAYRRGDLDALKEALGGPEGFPNCLLPF